MGESRTDSQWNERKHGLKAGNHPFANALAENVGKYRASATIDETGSTVQLEKSSKSVLREKEEVYERCCRNQQAEARVWRAGVMDH